MRRLPLRPRHGAGDQPFRAQLSSATSRPGRSGPRGRDPGRRHRLEQLLGTANAAPATPPTPASKTSWCATATSTRPASPNRSCRSSRPATRDPGLDHHRAERGQEHPQRRQQPNARAGSIDTISLAQQPRPGDRRPHLPTVAAPGSTIASTRNDTGGSCATPIAGTSNRYAFCSGTSMASPHVAGAVVLAAAVVAHHAQRRRSEHGDGEGAAGQCAPSTWAPPTSRTTTRAGDGSTSRG